MRDDELTKDPETTADDEERPRQNQADATNDAGTVDPKAAKSRPIEPKPHVRE